MATSVQYYQAPGKLATLMGLSLGEWMAISRQNRGLTQEELGKRTGFSRSVISRWETGQVEIRPEDMAIIARALFDPGLIEKYCAGCPVCQAKDDMHPRPAA